MTSLGRGGSCRVIHGQMGNEWEKLENWYDDQYDLLMRGGTQYSIWIVNTSIIILQQPTSRLKIKAKDSSSPY